MLLLHHRLRSLSYAIKWFADGRPSPGRVRRLPGRVMRGLAIAVVLMALGAAGALAQEFNLVIRDHKFEPAEIRVPAGKRVSIVVSNEDATPEEFDSSALKVEKVIAVKARARGLTGPLVLGRHEFIG